MADPGSRTRIFTWTRSGADAMQLCFEGSRDPVNTLQEPPVSIAVGNLHFLYLTDLGAVYTWGQGSFGKLGHGGNDFLEKPRRVDALASKRIVGVSAGDHHNLAIDEVGNCYAWGCNYNGRCGLEGGNWYPTPFLVEPLRRKRITQVACGRMHSLALSGDGQLFAWGSSAFGQLGLGNRNDCSTPTEVPHGTGVPVRQISAGFSHSVALMDDGRVFSWGLGSHGRLGLADMNDRLSPTHVTLVAEKARSVHAGGHFSIFVTADGHILSTAVAKNDRVRSTLARLPHIPGGVVDVGVGFDHILVLNDASEVFEIGSASTMEATGSTGLVRCDFQNAGARPGESVAIYKIAAGGDASIAVTGFLRSVLGEDLRQLLYNPVFSDVVFCTADGAKIPAHLVVIAARCPAMVDWLRPQLPPLPRSRDAAPATVEMTEEREAVFNFLVFLYCDTVPACTSASSDKALTELAVRFKCPRLVAFCRGLGAPKSTLASDMMGARGLSELSDIALVCELPEVSPRFEFKTHRAILCARSKYFSSMFTSNMREASMPELNLSDSGAEVVDALLDYVYADKVEMSPTLAVDVLCVANQYQLARLKNLCEGVIEKGVDSETVAYVWKAAVLYEAKRLEQFCQEIILAEWAEVTRSEAWQEQLTDDERAALSQLRSPVVASAPPIVEAPSSAASTAHRPSGTRGSVSRNGTTPSVPPDVGAQAVMQRAYGYPHRGNDRCDVS